MNHFGNIVNTILCVVGLHKWKHNVEPVNLVSLTGIKTTNDYDTRTCQNCGKKQLYTKRPSCNGYSDNEWITLN